MTTHTPGPWEWRNDISDHQDGECLVAIADAANGRDEAWLIDATFPYCEGAAEQDRLNANLALIAAAPDLLAALRWALPYAVEHAHPEHRERMAAAYAAIAKAEGE